MSVASLKALDFSPEVAFGKTVMNLNRCTVVSVEMEVIEK